MFIQPNVVFKLMSGCYKYSIFTIFFFDLTVPTMFTFESHLLIVIDNKLIINKETSHECIT